MKKLSELLPIDEITDRFFVTSYDTITYGYKVEMPEVYTMGNFEAEGFFQSYRNALKKLGTNVIVQKYGVFYPTKWESEYRGDSETRRWNEMRYDGRPVMDVEHYIFVSFYFGTANIASEKNPFSGKKLKSIVNRRYSNLKKSNIDEYEKILRSFEVTLGYNDGEESGGLLNKVDRMNSDDILHFLERYLSCDFSEKKHYDYASYDLRNGFKVGNREVSVLSMRGLPSVLSGFGVSNGVVQDGTKYDPSSAYSSDVKLGTSFLFALGMGLPFEHILCETMVLLQNEKIEAVLKKELDEIRFLTGLGRNDAIDKRNIVNNFIAATPQNELHTCKYGLSIIFPHLTEDKIEITTQVQNIASDVCGIQLYCENRSDLKTFIANIPGCGHTLNGLRIGWVEVMCMVTHLESFKNGNRHGVQLVDMFGKPFLFDFWDKEMKNLKARNAIILAPTGEGKSFTTNHFLNECFHLGDYIYLIDVGGSYKRLTELNGGLYYDSKDFKTFTFNPFKMAYRHESSGKWYPTKNALGREEEEDGSVVEFLATLVLSLWYRQTKVEIPVQTKELIKDSIKLFYNYVNESPVGKEVVVNFDSYFKFIIEDFNKELKSKDIDKKSFDVQQFSIMCKAFIIGGEYELLLNAETHVSLENRWVCFDLEGVAKLPDIAGPVTLIVMNLVQTKIDTLNGKPLRFWIDEAIDFIGTGIFGEYIGGLYRKIRKKGGQIAIITQSIRFLDGLDKLVESSILGNTSIKIILNHNTMAKDDIELLQKRLSLTDSETKLLRQMEVTKATPYRIVFIKFGNMPGFLFRLEVSKQSFAIFNTDADEVAKINEVRERTGSLTSAVETYVENGIARKNNNESNTNNLKE